MSSYYGFEEHAVAAIRRRELPIGAVVLIVGFGPRLDLTYPHLGQDRDLRSHAFVAGLHDTWCMVERCGVGERPRIGGNDYQKV